MYFVNMGGMSGYVLFSTTPRGRAAVGVTDTGTVRLLAPGNSASDWHVLREWPIKVYSHTELMTRLGTQDEPERAEDLLAGLPPETVG